MHRAGGQHRAGVRRLPYPSGRALRLRPSRFLAGRRDPRFGSLDRTDTQGLEAFIAALNSQRDFPGGQNERALYAFVARSGTMQGRCRRTSAGPSAT